MMLWLVTFAVSDLVESSEADSFPKSTLLSLISSVVQVIMAVPFVFGTAVTLLITGGTKSGMVNERVFPLEEVVVVRFCEESFEVTLK